MTAQLVVIFLHANLALTLVLALLLATRSALRRALGIDTVMALWGAVPLAVAGAILPLDYAAGPAGLVETGDRAAKAWLHQQHRADWLAALWTSGVLVSAGVGWMRLRRFLEAARQGLAGPAALGFVTPRLVVPSDFADRFTPQERRLVRAHERAHMDRLDGRSATLATIGAWLCWPNPLAAVALKAFRLDQELACDAAVMNRHPTKRRRYAEMLLRVRSDETNPLLCVSGWSDGALRVRVETLALRRVGRARIALACQVAMLAWIAAFLLGWAVQAPWRVVPGF